jgi:RNA polymerase sigma-70 factor (ECF subfamily)
MNARPAFDQIAQEHGAMIRRIASGYEADRHLADELVQDIFLAIWRALPAFRGASSLRTFVARIATNRAVTHVARAATRPASIELSDDLPSQGDTPEDQAIELNRHAHLMAAIRGLPLADRQVVTLTLEGLAPGEIADFLGMTANAVSIRLSRSKTLLRARLGEIS